MHDQLSWRHFEQLVERAVTEALDPQVWRVATQWERRYRDGQLKRMDLHVAERRRGGRSVVIDAKHFTRPLPKHEIDTTLDYKKRARASLAVLIVSSTTTIPKATQTYADKHKVIIIKLNNQSKKHIKSIFDDVLALKPSPPEPEPPDAPPPPPRRSRLARIWWWFFRRDPPPPNA